MEKKEQIYLYIRKDTLNKLKSKNYDNLGLDTLSVSLDLKMNRANISRLLNQLYNEGRIIKTASRPVLFIDRASLETYIQNTYIPSIIPKDKELKDYLSDTADYKEENTVNSFSRYITNLRHSKMAEPVKRAKSAILYPSGLNTIIIGDRGTGRFQFARAMANYAKEVQFVDEKKKASIVECLNYNVSNEESFLKLLFGEYIAKNNAHKKGLFQQSQNNIIILNNMDQLPSNALSALYSAILDKSFSPINSQKIYELKTLIIATSSKPVLGDDGDIRRCFPMLINLPNLHERSIVEKLVLILQYLQDEAALIDNTIRISKDALSCFVMSEYKGNLAHLRVEIRQACAMGYQDYLNKNAFFIDIDFDEISTPVLENIFDVDKRIDELKDTLNLFTNDYLFFSSRLPNPELQLLYDLDRSPNAEENLNIQTIGEEMTNQCIADIESASSIQMNTIRSLFLQKIYKLVYPLIKKHAICKNEKLLYGLLLHISNEIDRITSNNTTLAYSNLTNKIARASDYTYAMSIIHAVQETYKILFPESEADYIATYLYLSSQWINKRYIQLLIISSNKETSKNYADFINGQSFKTYASYITLPPDETTQDIIDTVTEKMNQIDKGRGIIIITDNPVIRENSNLISMNYHGEFTTMEDLTIQKIVSIAKRVESLGATIQSSNVFENFTITETAQNTPIQTHAQELLQDIQDKLLSESLIFLNPEKTCQSLFNVLLNIISDLSIQYSDDLLIKFIFHTAFTLERCIRKEPYVYPKSRSLIRQNRKLFDILEKNFETITEIFSVQIPAGEMGFIIEIFLPYCSF